MKVRRRGVLCGAAGAAILLALSPSATAKPGYFVFPAVREASLALKGTHGYRVRVGSIGRDVELTASKGHAAATYTVHGRRTTLGGIEAAFPGLGRISVRFHPSGRARHEPPFCKGKPSLDQPGIFRGTIRFEGEQGYTRVASGQAHGSLRHTFKEVCKDTDEGSSTSTPGYSLTAASLSPSREIVFGTFRSTAESFLYGNTFDTAFDLERRPGMLVSRSAIREVDPRSFIVEGPAARPNAASVAPPAPFTGSATFHGTAGAPGEWQGTLGVDLPGVSLELAGPSFLSQLCLNKHCVGSLKRERAATARLARWTQAGIATRRFFK